MVGMLLISADIIDPFRKLRSFRKSDMGVAIIPEDETSGTTQYWEAFLKYVENLYCAKHRRLPIITPDSLPSNDQFSSAMASSSGLSSCVSYTLCANAEEYLIPKDVAKTMPGQSNHIARSLSATWLYLNSMPGLPQNWAQINPNLDDYHSDHVQIPSTYWLPDITNWWRQQVETHSKYANLSNVAHDEFSITPHVVGMEASYSLRRNVIGWRQSKTAGETLCEKVLVRQFAWANSRILSGDDPALDVTNTENKLKTKREDKERLLHRLANVNNFLEMWQGSQNLGATPTESHAKFKHMTAVGDISDTKEIVTASWSNFQHVGAAAFRLSERSPVPPALSANVLPGGHTQVLNVC